MNLTHSLPVGDHELTFTFDLGVVGEQGTFRGLDGRPGTADKWAGALAQWQTVVKHKVRVVDKDQPVIEVVTDPQANPLKSVTLTVEQVLARPATKGTELFIKWKYAGDPEPALSYRIWVQAGEQKIDFGRLTMATIGRSSRCSLSSRRTVKSLPADVKTIDVLLTPDPKVAEECIGLERIWGQPMQFHNLGVERFDLEQLKTVQ